MVRTRKKLEGEPGLPRENIIRASRRIVRPPQNERSNRVLPGGSRGFRVQTLTVREPTSVTYEWIHRRSEERTVHHPSCQDPGTNVNTREKPCLGIRQPLT